MVLNKNHFAGNKNLLMYRLFSFGYPNCRFIFLASSASYGGNSRFDFFLRGFSLMVKFFFKKSEKKNQKVLDL